MRTLSRTIYAQERIVQAITVVVQERADGTDVVERAVGTDVVVQERAVGADVVGHLRVRRGRRVRRHGRHGSHGAGHLRPAPRLLRCGGAARDGLLLASFDSLVHLPILTDLHDVGEVGEAPRGGLEPLGLVDVGDSESHLAPEERLGEILLLDLTVVQDLLDPRPLDTATQSRYMLQSVASPVPSPRET